MRNIFLIAVIAVMAVAFGCKDGDDGKNDPTDNPNEVKERSTTVSLSGVTGSITVKGIFDKAGLDNVANKIAGQINTQIVADKVEFGEQATVDYYNLLLTRSIVYIVEASPSGYSNFKLIGDGKTVYIAFGAVDTKYVIDGLGGIYNNGSDVS